MGASSKFITLITHSDTVLSNYRAFQLDLEQEKAFGSGVIDNKGGLVVGLSALKRFLTAFSQNSILFALCLLANEEMGSVGFTDIFRQLGQDTVVALDSSPLSTMAV